MKPDIRHLHYDDGTHAFDYTLHLKPRLKHRYIRIRDGHPFITANQRTSSDTLQAFITDHAEWIGREMTKSAAAVRDLTHPDATIMWRGKSYPITVHHGKRNHLEFFDDNALVTLKEAPTHTTILSLVHQHYKAHASKHLLPRVDHWAELMDSCPAHISFRRARSRWGSCSSTNRISLNTHLMMLPDDLIDYVIVHELAHIAHKNHGQYFWAQVQYYIPDYSLRRQRLRPYEAHLL